MPIGVGVGKHAFLVRICTFPEIPVKNSFVELDPNPYPYPHRSGSWKNYFSVQICTFHFIPSKNSFGKLNSHPHSQSIGMGVDKHKCSVWVCIFHAIPRKGFHEARCLRGFKKHPSKGLQETPISRATNVLPEAFTLVKNN